MSVTIAPTGTQDLELGDFTTERGEVLAEARLRYRIMGDQGIRPSGILVTEFADFVSILGRLQRGGLRWANMPGASAARSSARGKIQIDGRGLAGVCQAAAATAGRRHPFVACSGGSADQSMLAPGTADATFGGAHRDPVEKPEARRLIKRLRRHQHDLLTFLDHEGVPSTTTTRSAEIRPAVIIRKNSYGNRSEAGADTQAVLMTVFRTLKQRDHEPMKTIVAALKPDRPCSRP